MCGQNRRGVGYDMGKIIENAGAPRVPAQDRSQRFTQAPSDIDDALESGKIDGVRDPVSDTVRQLGHCFIENPRFFRVFAAPLPYTFSIHMPEGVLSRHDAVTHFSPSSPSIGAADMACPGEAGVGGIRPQAFTHVGQGKRSVRFLLKHADRRESVHQPIESARVGTCFGGDARAGACSIPEPVGDTQ
jgi:hypothetical protein